jgi:hypothetical protein
MINELKAKALLLAFLGCALLGTISSAAAQKETVLESNDEGEVTLTQPTKVGDLTLQPDTYVVQHRVSGGRHFIRFMQVVKTRDLRVTRTYTGWYTHTELKNAGETKCRVEPLGAKAQATTVTVATENGAPRITRVMIKGKADAYVF